MTAHGGKIVSVLLIDDNPAHADIVAGVLSETGPVSFAVEHALTAGDGVARLRTGGPDVVLVGLSLPDAPGLEALTLVRRTAAAIPAMVLADDENPAQAIEAVRQGAHDYLPVDTISGTMLSRIIRHALERARHETALAESTVMHRSLLASIQTPVLALDEHLSILYCNEAYARFVGMPIHELEGRKLIAQFPTFAETASYAAYHAALKTGAMQEVEGRFEGRYLRARIYRTPFGILAMAEDVSERRHAEEVLREQTQELASRNEELEAFSHTVAHDLRNPLGVIQGFTEQLLDHLESLPPVEVRNGLEAIAQASSKMNDMIDALLLLAGVRRTKEVPLRLLDMRSLAHEALRRLDRLSAEYGAEVVIPDSLPPVRGYAQWVEEVWVNYLSNAILHGGRPPRVEIGATTDGRIARFWVRDNGPGIHKADRKNLFAPFTRLRGAGASGHGLGLSIVRRITERLGGESGVESEPGQGSAFWFSLPVPESG